MISVTHPSEPSPRRLELLLLALLAFALSWAVSGTVFRFQRITGDEGSYLFQAHTFADGVVRRDPGPYAELLRHDMIILDEEAGWLSRYPPAHSLWLAAGVLLGSPHLMTALASALTLVALTLIGRMLRMPRLLMPLLLLASPFFLLMSGTLLSHTSGMAASAWMLYFFMRWQQERDPRLAIAAGLCWSFLFLNRTWTAALVAIPFAIYSLSVLRNEKRNLRYWIGVVLFAVSALVGVVLFLRYNKLTTGHSREATYLLYEKSEGLGFGLRRLQGGELHRVNHTVRRGLGFFWNNLRQLDVWMLGTPVGTLLLWLGLGGHGWNRRWSGFLLGVGLSVPLGYVAFWFEGIPTVGPLYLTETLPYWLLFGGLGLSRLWRRLEKKPIPRALFFGVMGCALLLSSIRFTLQQVTAIRDAFSAQWDLEEKLLALPGDNLVFVYGEPVDRTLRNYLFLNEKGLRSRILRLQAHPENHSALAACFPGRKAWFLQREGDSFVLTPIVEPFRLAKREASNSHHSRGTGSNEGPFRKTEPGNEEAGFLFFGWYQYLPAGNYECRFDIRWEDVEAERPIRLEVMADLGRRSLGEQTLRAGLDKTVVTFSLSEAAHVEPRVFFGGSGSALLRGIELQRLDSPPPPL